MKFAASIILIFLGLFTSTAIAAEAVNTDPETSELVRSIFDAVVNGHWWPALCAVVVLACALELRYAPRSWKTGTRGEIIGVAVAFVMSFAATLGASAAAPGTTMTLALVTMSLKVGVGAIGGYTVLRRVLGWLAAWGKLPLWARAALNVIAAVIGVPSAAKAEAAGDAAVKAAPAPGMAAGGAMREVE